MIYYIETENRSAVFNMAADLYIMRKCIPGHIFIRFYTWNSKTVSLGRFQKPDGDFIDHLKSKGYGMITRPSGGRAVIHDNSLTYSFAAPLSLFPDNSMTATYKRISNPFIEIPETNIKVSKKTR
ncbi:MAG: lipoate--protein ligase family protein, partial [Candidatus Muiribacteriaceae bacterium]